MQKSQHLRTFLFVFAVDEPHAGDESCKVLPGCQTQALTGLRWCAGALTSRLSSIWDLGGRGDGDEGRRRDRRAHALFGRHVAERARVCYDVVERARAASTTKMRGVVPFGALEAGEVGLIDAQWAEVAEVEIFGLLGSLGSLWRRWVEGSGVVCCASASRDRGARESEERGQGGRDARVPDVVAEGYYEDVDPEEERRRIEEWLEERHPCGLL